MPHRIRNADIVAARDAGVIDDETYERLACFLASRSQASSINFPGPSYDLVHLLWYAGALIVLSAMGLFSTMAFGIWGAHALLTTSVIYAVMFLTTGRILWRRELHTPGGLLITCAVGMTPLGVFAAQTLLGAGFIDTSAAYHDFYALIKSSWLPMELATIFTACLALYCFPFPFLTMIIAFCLWFISMDITPLLMQAESFTWDQRATVSLYFGLVLVASAWLIDLRPWKNGDFAFWLHLSGLLTLWGGLTMQQFGGELSKTLYASINIGLIFFSLLMMRRAYAIFGALGVTLYLGYLSAEVFRNSILFPFALSAIGMALIAFGLLFQRYSMALADYLQELLPAYLQGLTPAHRRQSD